MISRYFSWITPQLDAIRAQGLFSIAHLADNLGLFEDGKPLPRVTLAMAQLINGYERGRVGTPASSFTNATSSIHRS